MLNRPKHVCVWRFSPKLKHLAENQPSEGNHSSDPIFIHVFQLGFVLQRLIVLDARNKAKDKNRSTRDSRLVDVLFQLTGAHIFPSCRARRKKNEELIRTATKSKKGKKSSSSEEDLPKGHRDKGRSRKKKTLRNKPKRKRRRSLKTETRSGARFRVGDK